MQECTRVWAHTIRPGPLRSWIWLPSFPMWPRTVPRHPRESSEQQEGQAVWGLTAGLAITWPARCADPLNSQPTSLQNNPLVECCRLPGDPRTRNHCPRHQPHAPSPGSNPSAEGSPEGPLGGLPHAAPPWASFFCGMDVSGSQREEPPGREGRPRHRRSTSARAPALQVGQAGPDHQGSLRGGVPDHRGLHVLLRAHLLRGDQCPRQHQHQPQCRRLL